MTRDTKVGMALGILLVGVVSAFFFRNETAEPQTQANAEPKPEANPYGERPLVAPGDELTDDWSTGSDLGERKLPFDPDALPAVEGPIAKSDSPTQPAAFRREKTPPDEIPIPSGKTYVVQPGETLTGIALKLFGRSSRYKDLYDANRDVMRNPDDIHAGMTLRLPDAEPNSTVVPEPPADPPFEVEQPKNPEPPFEPEKKSTTEPPFEAAPVRRPSHTFDGDVPPFDGGSKKKTRLQTYRVRQGENLERIAQRVYGDWREARRIFHANRDLLRDPRDLRSGMTIILPAKPN